MTKSTAAIMLGGILLFAACGDDGGTGGGTPGGCEAICTQKCGADTGCYIGCKAACTRGTDGTDGTDGTCTPDCAAKKCGPNGCGGFCGACLPGTACNSYGECIGNTRCTPSCDGKACGPDKCGGFCGNCEGGKACNGVGQCAGETGCTPACDGKQCGDDGCGSQCGKCPAGHVCTQEGACAADNSACGTVDSVGECQADGTTAVVCKAGKLIALLCNKEMGLVCGYNATKNKYDCIPKDCTPACSGKSCGSDGCGGLCGQCKPDETCSPQGVCGGSGSCTPSCSGKVCGADGCGGHCGICNKEKNEVCAGGQCVSSSGCTPKCEGKVCGADGCGGICGICKPDELCTGGFCKSAGCVPSCTGKSCGGDGCGGSCGTCPSGQTCDPNGHCVTVAGGSCGNLTYEGSCDATGLVVKWCEGSQVKEQDCTKYGPSYVCAWVDVEEYYWCLPECQAACVGKECGSNGCGGQCGACPSGKTCNAGGQCVTQGGGGACGDVSYEGICEGTTLKYCAGGEIAVTKCAVYGMICAFDAAMKWFSCQKSSECTPNCVQDSGAEKECGSDGCGNLCGVCQAGKTCLDGACTEGGDECGGIDSAGTCKGDVLSYCAGGSLYTQDCAAAGKKCAFVEEYGWYDCVEGGTSTGGTCGSIPDTGLCQDVTTLLYCAGDAKKTLDCGEYDLVCMYSPEADGGKGGYDCFDDPGCAYTCPAKQKCQIDGTCGCDGVTVAGACLGNVLVYCAGNELTTVDCTAEGLACKQSGAWYACD